MGDMRCCVECEMIRIVGDDTYQSSKKKVELFLIISIPRWSKCLAGEGAAPAPARHLASR